MSYLYSAYDLVIESGLPLAVLPLLPHPGTDADVRIDAGPVDAPPLAPTELRRIMWEGDGALLVYRDLVRIRVTRDAMRVEAAAGAAEEIVAAVLTGPAMAVLLSLRGDMVLHASCVSGPDGLAIAFAGDNRAGKSTLAHACLAQGGRLVNDDVLALPPVSPGALPVPRRGYPSVRLGEDVLPATTGGDGMPTPATSAAKAGLPVAMAGEGPLRLAHLYVIERGDALSTARLDPDAALAALMRYAYLPKLGPNAVAGARGAAQFRACAALADALPVSRLQVPGRLEDIGAVAAHVLAQAATDDQAQK